MNHPKFAHFPQEPFISPFLLLHVQAAVFSFFQRKMMTVFPFFILALVSAAPAPPSNNEETTEVSTVDMGSHDTGKSWKFTGKSWTVEATAKDTSSEVVIQLLQSEVMPSKGLGAMFLEDGRFPSPDEEYDGKVSDDAKEFSRTHGDGGDGTGFVVLSSLAQAAFCPKSDSVCKDGGWTARRTEMKGSDYFPVVDSPVMLETQVVFKDSDECDSFIAEWNGVCDS
jgi:hypothetical protein